MSSLMALMLMLANAPPEQTTMPRRPAADPVKQAAARTVTRPILTSIAGHVATDDPAFILQAVENTRQGNARCARRCAQLDNPQLREAAQKIGAQNKATNQRLEEGRAAQGLAPAAGEPEP